MSRLDVESIVVPRGKRSALLEGRESVVKTILVSSLCAILLVSGLGDTAAGGDLPGAAQETLDAYEKEAAEIDKQLAAEMQKLGEKATARLKILLDKYCKDAKLDEAVAVRDQMRLIQKGEIGRRAEGLPQAAVPAAEAFEKEAGEALHRAQEKLQKVRDKANGQLQTIQDTFCREGKLDEALAVREMRRLLQIGVTNVQPDPGYLKAQASDIGKVWYFEVVGNARESTWGTDVYTIDSHVGASAVHAGVLRDGQKGVVKVTILKGQANYPSTTRNGVTSYPWGAWGVSFKVERLTGLVRRAPKK
jgi:hypothetical protein